MTFYRLALRSSACALCAALLQPGCAESHVRSHADASPTTAADARAPMRDGSTGVVDTAPPLVWMVVHPSDAPRGPGIFLFDESRNAVVSRLPLPESIESPHALAWDGASLWLGGADLEADLLELDPVDGSVRSRVPGIRTEGITVDGSSLWLAEIDDFAGVRLVQRERDGVELFSVPLPTTTAQDLAIDRGALYYLVNDAVDRIVRFDIASSTVTDVARGVHVAPYAMAFDGSYLVVAVDQTLRRFDPATGELVRVTTIDMPGWITALTFVRSE